MAWSLGIKEIFTSVGMSQQRRGGAGSGLGWVKKAERQSRPRRHDQGGEGDQPGEGSVFESREEGSSLSSAARRSSHSGTEGVAIIGLGKNKGQSGRCRRTGDAWEKLP